MVLSSVVNRLVAPPPPPPTIDDDNGDDEDDEDKWSIHVPVLTKGLSVVPTGSASFFCFPYARGSTLNACKYFISFSLLSLTLASAINLVVLFTRLSTFR